VAPRESELVVGLPPLAALGVTSIAVGLIRNSRLLVAAGTLGVVVDVARGARFATRIEPGE
jgi:hypothetical protein